MFKFEYFDYLIVITKPVYISADTVCLYRQYSYTNFFISMYFTYTILNKNKKMSTAVSNEQHSGKEKNKSVSQEYTRHDNFTRPNSVWHCTEQSCVSKWKIVSHGFWIWIFVFHVLKKVFNSAQPRLLRKSTAIHVEASALWNRLYLNFLNNGMSSIYLWELHAWKEVHGNIPTSQPRYKTGKLVYFFRD